MNKLFEEYITRALVEKSEKESEKLMLNRALEFATTDLVEAKKEIKELKCKVENLIEAQTQSELDSKCNECAEWKIDCLLNKKPDGKCFKPIPESGSKEEYRRLYRCVSRLGPRVEDLDQRVKELESWNK